jgi:O-6-methylguanine DNA methyltransferase
MDLVELPIATGDGLFLARYSAQGLTRLYFPKSASLESRAQLPVPGTGKTTHPDHSRDRKIQILRWHKLTTTAVKDILHGRPPKEFPPLDFTGTDFQKAAWKAMLKIPAGKTKSYGEIAKAIGKPRAVRAVGSACGANSMPLLVPCHRVLAAHKKIGGFGSGLHWKRSLLAREGLEFNGDRLT